VAKKFGVLREAGYTERAIFLLDRKGIVRYIGIHDIGKQPSNEVLLAGGRPLPKGYGAHPVGAAFSNGR
jgi:hypothetical protein